MEKIFVDTAAWLALLNKDDDLHRQAQQVMQTLRRQHAALLTTEFVLLEVADALSAPAHRERTVKFITGLRSCPSLQFSLPVKVSGPQDGSCTVIASIRTGVSLTVSPSSS